MMRRDIVQNDIVTAAVNVFAILLYEDACALKTRLKAIHKKCRPLLALFTRRYKIAERTLMCWPIVVIVVCE